MDKIESLFLAFIATLICLTAFVLISASDVFASTTNTVKFSYNTKQLNYGTGIYEGTLVSDADINTYIILEKNSDLDDPKNRGDYIKQYIEAHYLVSSKNGSSVSGKTVWHRNIKWIPVDGDVSTGVDEQTLMYSNLGYVSGGVPGSNLNNVVITGATKVISVPYGSINYQTIWSTLVSGSLPSGAEDITDEVSGKQPGDMTVSDIDKNGTKDVNIGYLRDIKKYFNVENDGSGHATNTSFRTTWDNKVTTSGYSLSGNNVYVQSMGNIYGVQFTNILAIGDKSKWTIRNQTNKDNYVPYKNYTASVGTLDYKVTENSNSSNPLYQQYQDYKNMVGLSLYQAEYFLNFKLRVYTYESGKYIYGPWLTVQWSKDKVIYEATDENGNVTDIESGGTTTGPSDTTEGEQDITDASGTIVKPEDIEKIDLKSFINTLRTVGTSVQEFPQFLASMILFIPQSYVMMIGAGIIAIIILRFLGR